MKASLISKIIVLLCVLSLFLSYMAMDKHNLYSAKKSKSSKNIIAASNKIAVIELDGAIAASGDSSLFSHEKNASNMLRALDSAKEDKEIHGVILKINTPGGTVAMSQNIHNQILKVRETKPVITVMDDVAASGGYYIASASDRIIAQEGTLTGSIGVIFSFMDYHRLMIDTLKTNQIVIKSGKFKDIGSGARPMQPEERELLQDIVNDSYNQFLNAIKIGRIERKDTYNAEKSELSFDVLKEHADGRVFTGRKAKELGFVDIIGDMETAESVISQMAQERYRNGLPAKLIIYGRKNSFSEYFSSLTDYNSKSVLKLTNIIPTSIILNRKLLYLWE